MYSVLSARRLQKPELSPFKQMTDGENWVIIETKEKCSINISTVRLATSLWMVIEREAEVFACCSLLVTFCLLLVTFYSLLVTFYSLLVTFYSLLVTFYSLMVFFYSNYCEIKLLWTAKKWFVYKETPPHIFSLQISEI